MKWGLLATGIRGQICMWPVSFVSFRKTGSLWWRVMNDDLWNLFELHDSGCQACQTIQLLTTGLRGNQKHAVSGTLSKRNRAWLVKTPAMPLSQPHARLLKYGTEGNGKRMHVLQCALASASKLVQNNSPCLLCGCAHSLASKCGVKL